jgi:hypothetical protein
VKVTGGLSNGATSQINIADSATVKATLNVANAAAGFGTPGAKTGTIILENDALLEFKTGEITTITGELELNGKNSRVADSTATTTNSALTELSKIAGSVFLENGASVAPTGNVSVTGKGSLELDGPFSGGAVLATSRMCSMKRYGDVIGPSVGRHPGLWDRQFRVSRYFAPEKEPPTPA